MSEAAIRVDHLSYTYSNGFTALHDLNFEVKKQEFLAIIGQNGAGKSTLLKNFVGLHRPTEGNVFINGENTKDLAIAQLATRVGFVMQNPDRQLFANTVEEEIAFGPKNLKLPEGEIKSRIEAAMEATGITQYRKKFPMALSAGERAKVAIASVVVMNPEIIILDEPTTGQDRRGCAQIMDIAKGLQQKGRTVVVVTHNMSLVADYAERTLALCKGKILLQDETARVFAQEELLRTTFIMPPQVTQLARRIGVEQTILHTPELVALLGRELGK